MKKLTSQQAFTKVVNHLRRQKRKSMDRNKLCRYRTTRNGVSLMCAVGCLIPDELYSRNLEGVMLDTGNEELDSVVGQICDDFSLLEDLQYCHDHYEVQNWEKRFEKIAMRHSLKLPKTKKIKC